MLGTCLPEARARICSGLGCFLPKLRQQYDGADLTLQISNLDLGKFEGDTERSDKFWNRSAVAMKFTVEKKWLDAVWHCKTKRNYGTRNLDAVFEERCANKLELTGPLLDGITSCFFRNLEGLGAPV